jgi:hypothetical protein
MVQRCTSPNNQNYAQYGGRGVTVCDQWLTFANFLADMGDRPEGKTLDRIDNSKGYEPGNCRWATRKEQQRNRRSNRLLTHAGQTKTMAQWAEDLGVPYTRLQGRLKMGWSVDRVLG